MVVTDSQTKLRPAAVLHGYYNNAVDAFGAGVIFSEMRHTVRSNDPHPQSLKGEEFYK